MNMFKTKLIKKWKEFPLTFYEQNDSWGTDFPVTLYFLNNNDSNKCSGIAAVK